MSADTAKEALRPARHLDALTGIRGLAAWCVVIFHVRVTLLGQWPVWALMLASKGYLAVDLFFILSGFVLWYNYGARLAQGGWSTVPGFWWKRLARIWPLHALVLSAYVPLAVVLTVAGKDVSHYSFAALPLHYLLMESWGFAEPLTWNDPSWSISCELAAYLLFPLVAMGLRWDRMPTVALLAGGMVLLMALWGSFALLGHRTIGLDIRHTALARCLPEFTLGNILCVLWGRWRGRAGGWGAGLAAAAGVLVLGLGHALGLPETAVVPGAFCALVLALALDRGPVSRLLGGRVLSYLGEISYSTYLSHFLLFILYKLVFVSGPAVLNTAQLCAFLLLVLGASVVLYHGVEKPAQAWLNARSPFRGRAVAGRAAG